MQNTPEHNPSTVAVWSGALLSSLLGAAILFDAEPGINWPLWVASASAALILARKLSGLPVGKPILILLAWATLLACAAAITANEFILVLVFISDAMLLGLAVIITGAERWGSLSAKLLPTIPFLAPLRVLPATFREAASAPRTLSSPRARSVLKGLLLTLPIVIVLVALLRNADPVIAWIADRITGILPHWAFSGRVLFFLLLLSLTLGASSVSARQREPRLPGLPRLTTPGTIGFTEQRMVLTSIAVVLWLFVILQFSYLFHSPPSATGSGVTFADYARKGFAELSIAVTLVGGVILALKAMRSGDMDSRRQTSLVRLETALLIALELVLLSAFRKVVLYEQAYGFTTARLYAQAYMLAVALALVALWLETRKPAISIDFARRVSVIALGVFTVLAFWNHEAWIVNRNIDRSVRSGKFDASYAVSLSTDVIPVVVARRGEVPVAERAKIEAWLACRRQLAQRRWFEFNSSVHAATVAAVGQTGTSGGCVVRSTAGGAHQ